MFEVETLKYATLATVSRCGMVWFNDDIMTYEMMFKSFVHKLTLEEKDFDNYQRFLFEEEEKQSKGKKPVSKEQQIRNKAVQTIREMFEGKDSFAEKLYEEAKKLKHVMEFTKIRVLESTFALLRKSI